MGVEVWSDRGMARSKTILHIQFVKCLLFVFVFVFVGSPIIVGLFGLSKPHLFLALALAILVYSCSPVFNSSLPSSPDHTKGFASSNDLIPKASASLAASVPVGSCIMLSKIFVWSEYPVCLQTTSWKSIFRIENITSIIYKGFVV